MSKAWFLVGWITSGGHILVAKLACQHSLQESFDSTREEEERIYMAVILVAGGDAGGDPRRAVVMWVVPIARKAVMVRA